jgi:tetratricopeptide (TPR) repeat protein
MRALVADMLAAYDHDPEFLEASTDVAGSVAMALADGLVGSRLGPYRVTGQIGRGGMGVVYDAVRDDGEFERRVAIKVLPTWSGVSLVERFRLERRVLASLDHPGIARLVDSGTTPDGAPYFVMEFVDGPPIDVWARDQRLDVRARIALVERVCEAVAYAHQHLIVHRDLKPANILVPADGHPRLLDFGIATLLARADGVDTGVTATGHHTFTIDFASPEQIRGEAVTTATDVYSLGVLLYLLVAGRRPYTLKDLSPFEAMRTVCEVDPPPPSAVAASADAARTRGDLDAVIGKALRKAPRDRYATVAALASDLKAFRLGMPVTAAPESWTRQARRFVRRNKAAAAVLAAIVGGGSVAAWQARAAATERDRAERRFAQVREFSRSLIFDVNEALSQVPGNVEPRRLVLERAVSFLDGLASDVGNDQVLRLELAEGYRRLGVVQGGPTTENGGDRAAARRSLEKAARLVDAALADDPDGLEPLIAGLDVMADLRSVIARLGAGDARVAEARHRALLTSLEGRHSSDPRAVDAIARGYAAIAVTLEARSDYVGAERALSAALPLLERVAATGAKRRTRAQQASVLKRLGAVMQWQARLEDAERRYRQALALDEETLAEHPGDPAAQFEITITLSNLGGALNRLGRREEAMQLLSRALAIRRSLVAADPNDVRATDGLALLLGRFSTYAYNARRFADSVSYNREKVQLREAMVAREGSSPRTRSDRALARLELAMALMALAEAGTSETRAALLEEAGALMRDTPVSDFTEPSATAGVSVEVFRAQHALALARAGQS